ncbi:ATP-binding protein [Streptomyces apocyni]|uniref:ATP-binding protein n=1 Tax=Streptomyces apocyni TaxID=2654677 RepID=UPI0012E9963C|nr:ATP-binding protein [Streptomyces apocyni]
MRTENPADAAHTTELVFRQRLAATRRGARLARVLTLDQLNRWGIPYDSELSDTTAALVAELASNAVLHARVAGRGFELNLTLSDDAMVRIEVTDTRGDRPLRTPDDEGPTPTLTPEAESGRGLIVVAALADRWGVTDGPPPRKTVWAETHAPQ